MVMRLMNTVNKFLVHCFDAKSSASIQFEFFRIRRTLQNSQHIPSHSKRLKKRTAWLSVFTASLVLLLLQSPAFAQENPSAISINSPSVQEGNSGSTNLTFTVTLNPPRGEVVTVDYEVTVGGTATPGTDYTGNRTGTLTFNSGDLTKSINFSVVGDTTVEPDETVIVTLRDQSPNAHLQAGNFIGTGTIRNDDREAVVLSSDNRLRALSISEGTLSPGFSSPVESYSVTVGHNVASVTVTPTANHSRATISVNDISVRSGTASRSISLSEGQNTIRIIVTAENNAQRTYRVVVTRQSPPEPEVMKSSDNRLRALSISEGTLSPDFSNSVQSYSVTVSSNVASLTVTPTANHSRATISVNNNSVRSGSASGPIRLSDGENTITITVTAENNAQRIYRVVVTRQPADLTPDAFSFQPKTDAEPGATVMSNSITVSGLSEGFSTSISVSGGTLMVDGDEFSGTTVSNGQRVAVVVVASDEFSSTATARVTIGGVSAEFSVTTKAKPVPRLSNAEREIVAEMAREVGISVIGAVEERTANDIGAPSSTPPSTSFNCIRPFLNRIAEYERDRIYGKSQSSLHRTLDNARFACSLFAGGLGANSSSELENNAVVWGSIDYRDLSGGRKSLADWSGEMVLAHVGTDTQRDAGTLAGMAASISRGTFDYVEQSENTRGQIKSRMTVVYPYVGWPVSDTLRLWATVGFGKGNIEKFDDSNTRQFSSSTEFLMSGFGGRYRLVTDDQSDAGVATLVDLKAEAYSTSVTVNDDLLENANQRNGTYGLRIAVEGLRERKLDSGARFIPSGELGVRWDGGAGDTGSGVEIGGGVKYIDECECRTVDGNARILVTHNSGRKGWSGRLSATGNMDNNNAGMSYNVSLVRGSAGNKAGSIWERSAVSQAQLVIDSTLRFESEVGYGVYGKSGLYTPYVGFGFQEGSDRSYRMGVRFSNDLAVTFGMELERRELKSTAPDHRVMLTGATSW